jgi:hypothetical protein
MAAVEALVRLQARATAAEQLVAMLRLQLKESKVGYRFHREIYVGKYPVPPPPPGNISQCHLGKNMKKVEEKRAQNVKEKKKTYDSEKI